MERYCISLEQAKKLWELGFSVGFAAKYYWVDWPPAAPLLTDLSSLVEDADVKYPALHVGELGETLRFWVSDVMHHCSGVWEVYWEPCFDKSVSSYPTEAQARGALLINLVEEGLIDVSFRKSVNN